ncbi:hypothetical protein GGX14DRAFT_403703 [Mycena pura]|uniref:Uncharacterized protein n=1 Tax=Mycena pura TaxID=153505 RepID=A0AAD6Y657_9AGAR|nr:hypothetical protein GGX14DRAFT_403703 [Mycena pura]
MVGGSARCRPTKIARTPGVGQVVSEGEGTRGEERRNAPTVWRRHAGHTDVHAGTSAAHPLPGITAPAPGRAARTVCTGLSRAGALCGRQRRTDNTLSRVTGGANGRGERPRAEVYKEWSQILGDVCQRPHRLEMRCTGTARTMDSEAVHIVSGNGKGSADGRTGTGQAMHALLPRSRASRGGSDVPRHGKIEVWRAGIG